MLMPIKKKTRKTTPKKIKTPKKLLKWSKTNEIIKQKEYRAYIEKKFQDIVDNIIIVDFVDLSFRYVEQPKEEIYGDIIFSIKFVKPYRRAYVNIYPASYDIYKNKQFQDLERAVIHELCHIHTTHLADLSNNRYSTEKELRETTEELTELICEYVVRLLKTKGRKTNNE